MNRTLQRLEEIKLNGFSLDFSDIFNQTIENYKKIALNAGLAFLLLSVIMGVVFGSAFGFIYGTASLTETLTNFNIQNFSTLALITYIFAVALISAFTAPFYAGILQMANLADQNQEFSIQTAFFHFKSKYFKDLVISSVVVALVTVGISVIFETISSRFIGGFITYAITFMVFMTKPLIIFGNLNAIDSIKASLLLMGKQIPVLAGLLIVSILMIFLGLIGLCIGIFFTFPFIFSLQFIIYKNILGVNSVSEIEEIGNFIE